MYSCTGASSSYFGPVRPLLKEVNRGADPIHAKRRSNPCKARENVFIVIYHLGSRSTFTALHVLHFYCFLVSMQSSLGVEKAKHVQCTKHVQCYNRPCSLYLLAVITISLVSGAISLAEGAGSYSIEVSYSGQIAAGVGPLRAQLMTQDRTATGEILRTHCG